GGALQFSGQPLLLPASPSLQYNAGGAFTLSAWVRLDQASGDQLLMARREGGHAFLLGVSQGTPFVEVNGQRAVSTQPLNPGQWQHLALTAQGSKVSVFVNGRETASLAQEVAAFNSPMAIGGDLPAVDPAAAPSAFAAFNGAIDELRLSKVVRPAAVLLADATAQGAESKLVAYGADEEQSGFGFGSLGFLLKSVPADAWVIIAILVLMMLQSWVIMIRKNRALSRVSRANEAFREQFAQVGTRLEMFADDQDLARRLEHSSLWRLYLVAVKEIRTRRAQGADTSSVSAATIEAIRCSMDGVRTRENQQLGSKLSTLSNAIAGGPYIGLLGTVLGIMVVFLGTAMAGDVNINAIAPGMAAALLATAMGLFVAIPALFGYNRLITRNKEVSADMRVFVDEFITRLAEMYGEGQVHDAARGRGGQSGQQAGQHAIDLLSV
ncbi:MotA/TolQ/ExbB proton channel family protein, partial [Pseudomonas asplenii]|uniref:MotA/TolQ/ExbB proton channel family protein n=1 Tax=Pseudomonas asplenii TaxID=53407 RepID=UPI00037A90A6